jgi:hypothetical protein
MNDTQDRTTKKRRRPWPGLAAGLLIGLLAPAASPADAHCDSVEGPVVAAAKRSLSSGDTRYVLAYVAPASESELTAAFREATRVRRLSPAARDLADRYFFETAVRLHRAGEGAAYTGLKDDVELGPALEAAEKAIATGRTGGAKAVLVQALADGLDHRWQAVQAARAAGGKSPSVEALRAIADAELAYELYVHDVYQALRAPAHGAEPEVARPPAGETGRAVADAHTHGTEN